MTSERLTEFDRQLMARCWRYDVGNEEFCDASGALLDWEDLIGLVPGLSLDDLDAYRERRYLDSRG